MWWIAALKPFGWLLSGAASLGLDNADECGCRNCVVCRWVPTPKSVGSIALRRSILRMRAHAFGCFRVP
jgi:hypothetical protein